MNVQVIDFRLLCDGKSLRAFADILIGDWVIREWRVVKEDGKRLRVIPPQISWKTPEGVIQYKTVITLPDELKGQIDFAILKRFTEEMERKNAKQTHR